MTAEVIKETYWRYYLSLEAQVVELERFIEFDLRVNGNTYSARLLELYQAICSEVDVIGKILAKECDASFVHNGKTGIMSWWYVIQNCYSSIQSEQVFFKKTTLIPWKKFFVEKKDSRYVISSAVADSSIPAWWTSYNKVKHSRTDNDCNGLAYYSHANLANVIYALAGLYILETMLVEKVNARVFGSSLFSCKGHDVFSSVVLW